MHTRTVLNEGLKRLYIAQYPTHDETTLSYLQDALDVYHKNNDILKTLGVRKHLNIPKFHSLQHYIDSIRNLGTTDNYSTEMFERLHIDFAKKAWRASNHRDERPQMVRWLERQEKVAMYETLRERLDAMNEGANADACGGNDGLEDDRHHPKTGVLLAKHPSVKQQSIQSIVSKHQAPGFGKALAQHVYGMKLGRPLTSREVESAPEYLPFSRLDVYHGFKFTTIPLSDNAPERDAVKARPARGAQPARFDTVVVLQGEEAQASGMQGMLSTDYRVLNVSTDSH